MFVVANSVPDEEQHALGGRNTKLITYDRRRSLNMRLSY